MIEHVENHNFVVIKGNRFIGPAKTGGCNRGPEPSEDAPQASPRVCEAAFSRRTCTCLAQCPPPVVGSFMEMCGAWNRHAESENTEAD
jgi:hypothetical protein